MAAKYLAINLGSQSKKYALAEAGQIVAREHLEPGVNLSAEQFANSLEMVLDKWGKTDIAAVGLRIVAPGTFFTSHQLFDDDYRSRLAAAARDWPLHLAPVISELAALDRLLPGVSLVGVSDSAFHNTMPERARRLPLQSELSDKLDLRHFGYHGLALASVIRQLGADLPAKLIVAHLGGGASVTAIRRGASINTSMGYSPIGGLPMSTRVGDLDPGVFIHLMRYSGLLPENLLKELESNSGLLALSNNLSGEVRELLSQEAAGNPAAGLALEAFLAGITKYIGAYFALLGGADRLVLTGTVAERSPSVVSRLTAAVSHFIPADKIQVTQIDELTEIVEATVNLVK